MLTSGAVSPPLFEARRFFSAVFYLIAWGPKTEGPARELMLFKEDTEPN